MSTVGGVSKGDLPRVGAGLGFLASDYEGVEVSGAAGGVGGGEGDEG